jgi:hypothetical protein
MSRALSLSPEDPTVANELQEARTAALAAGVSLDGLSSALDVPAPPHPPSGLVDPEQIRKAQEARAGGVLAAAVRPC